jgi:hypothetical protein
MDIGSLVGVVLGAVLAVGTGLVTELWKQGRARRAAARLVWLELRIAHKALLGAIAVERWSPDYEYSDGSWAAHRDQLALGWSASEFQDLEEVYLILGSLFRQPLSQRANPVLYWKVFERVNAAFLSLGKTSGLKKVTLDKIKIPPLDQLKQLRAQVEPAVVTPQPGRDEVMARALKAFPPELRASAEAALVKAWADSPSQGTFIPL